MVVERDERGRFKPGCSGYQHSPGRPKGLAQRVREQTQDGAEIVAFYWSVFRGEQGAKLADRMAAAQWLAERGWGKAIQASADVTPDPEGALAFEWDATIDALARGSTEHRGASGEDQSGRDGAPLG